jgi:hypothetical protein
LSHRVFLPTDDARHSAGPGGGQPAANGASAPAQNAPEYPVTEAMAPVAGAPNPMPMSKNAVNRPRLRERSGAQSFVVQSCCTNDANPSGEPNPKKKTHPICGAFC